MSEKAEIESPMEDKSSFSPVGWLGWLAGFLILYVFSVGPFMLMIERGYITKSSQIHKSLGMIYKPLEAAYDTPFLHKPLGIYGHLWVPRRFDKNGDLH